MLHRIAASTRRGALLKLYKAGLGGPQSSRLSAEFYSDFLSKLIRGCSPQIQNRVVTDLLKVVTDLHAVGTGPSEVVTDLLKVGTDFIEAVPTSLKVGTD
jgi:hypothetical protein